jgi:OOP family OmpA-OmpF porin
MRTRKTNLVGLVIILGMVLLGLSATDVSAFEVLTEQDTVRTVITEKDLVRTVDNFIILFDASGSMDAKYKDTGLRRIEVAKKILQERNAKLPELGYKAGLYVFGPQRPLHDLKLYNRAAFGKAIDQLPTTTRVATRRSKDIRELDALLAGTSGKTAVFMFTDGQFTPPGPGDISVVDAAKGLAAKHDICIYPISSAATPRQEMHVKNLASVNACSRVIPFDALYGRPEYVAGILFALEDIMLVEEGTITKVVAARVDNVLFDFDQSDIRPEFNEELDQLGKFMQTRPDTYVVIDGYSDSLGSTEYNMLLSRRRAEGVADYLMNNHNIGSDRMVVLWYGKANPVASNETAEGRAKNRRVEMVVGGSL